MFSNFRKRQDSLWTDVFIDMRPRTNKGEKRHKIHKRACEIETILDSIFDVIKDSRKNNLSILEFGSGDGYNIPYLKRIGHVIASDIVAKSIYKDVPFVQCNIVNPPFLTNSFDIIFSNHVIGHIGDMDTTFEEMKRIGKDELWAQATKFVAKDFLQLLCSVILECPHLCTTFN